MRNYGAELWEKIEAGHETQEGLLLLLATLTRTAAVEKHEYGKVRALAAEEILIHTECSPSAAVSSAERVEKVMDAKLQSDLAAGELMVVKERLKTLDGQLKRLQSGFVSWRAP